MGIFSVTDFLRTIRKKPEDFWIIHYSCQNLYGGNDGLSPRVTSIVTQHFATKQTHSFSTHSVAEELGIVKSKVTVKYDIIERQLLTIFFDFVRDQKSKYWLHWNMNNLIYGFEHLEHRFRALTKKEPPSIPVERRLNINDYLGERYGWDFAPDPRLLNLMELNGGRHRHFLKGEEEVEAFKAQEFIRMHNSTLCKVDFMQRVIEKLLSGTLRTKSRGYGQMLDRIYEGRTVKSLTLVGTVIGISTSLIGLYFLL